jgi:transposase-like protein
LATSGDQDLAIDKKEPTMTVTPSIDGARLIEEQLAQASPDLLRELLTTFINTLMSAEADAVCGAAYGTSSPDRTNRRNGYRHRDFDTRTGTLDLEVPKLRTGSYFPEWLLERRKRAERALTTCSASAPDGWTSWSNPSASPH